MDLAENRPLGFLRSISPEDKPFYLSLSVSLIIHAAIIIYFSTKKINVLKRDIRQIEVTYQALEKKTVKPRDDIKTVKALKDEARPRKVEILTKESRELPFFERSLKDVSKLSEHFRFSQKQNPDIKTLDMSRNISVPMLKSEKINNPKYLSYNQNIRQLIKQQAYRYVENPQFRSGEVYLSFILEKNGNLQDLHVVEGRSHASDFLKSAGMRSIHDANPFPPFPQDLNYPELTFNVVISFEVNE